MTNHRLSLLAGLGLLQIPLLGCPQGGFSETSDSTGTTTTPIDDTTYGHIQTVTGDVPTTGITTGEGDTDPGQTALEESCTNCGNPETVQVCFCVDNSAAKPVLRDTFYACLGDATLEATAAQSCIGLLGKQALDAGDLQCMQQIMCSIPGTGDRLEDQCNQCGGPEVKRFVCVADINDVLVFDHYACEDDPGAASTIKAECAEALGKAEVELTATNFFYTIATCPGDDTTGGATTGDDTTAGGSTGDSTTSGATTGGDTSGPAATDGDTTGADTSGGSTAGSDTTNGDTTGGVAPLVGCADWDPTAVVAYDGQVYSVDLAAVTDLLADPTPLLDCDDVRLIARTDGGFAVRHADPGELLHELGLRDDDVPLALNGYGLTDTSDVILAVGQLWFIEEATDYQLVVSRAGRPYTLSYRLTN